MRSANVQGGQVPGLEGGGVDVNVAGPAEGEDGESLTEQITVIEELEELPDQGQETGSERLPKPEEPPDIIGPVTISRRKCMKAKC